MAQTQTLVVLDGYGIGSVQPTDTYSDDEVSAAVSKAQQPVEDTAIVCIDERRSHNGAQPVRRKTAGGNAVSGFAGGILADWTMLDGSSKSANEAFTYTAQVLARSGMKLGCHIDNHAAGQKTGCGANDRLPEAIATIAELGASELAGIVAAVMEDEFDAMLYEKVVAGANKLVTDQFLGDWDNTQVTAVVQQYDGVVEELNGDNDPATDPENTRHNHWAEAIVKGKQPGHSNNRDAAAIPFFQFDAEAINEIAEKMAYDAHEANLLKHAIYTYNVAVGYILTKNQRYIPTA
jgi:hypothetical protein